MNVTLSLRQLLAPFVGGLVAWLASKGFNLPPEWADALITLLSGLAGGAWHVIETRANAKRLVTLATGAAAGTGVPPPPSGSGPGGTVAKALIGALALGVLLQAGCAALGLKPGQTTAQRFGYAYAAVTAALNTLAQGLSAGTITREQGGVVNQDLMTVSGQLDTARQLLCGADPKCATPSTDSTGLDALTAATAALAKISAYLACRQSKGASCPLP